MTMEGYCYKKREWKPEGWTINIYQPLCFIEVGTRAHREIKCAKATVPITWWS